MIPVVLESSSAGIAEFVFGGLVVLGLAALGLSCAFLAFRAILSDLMEQPTAIRFLMLVLGVPVPMGLIGYLATNTPDIAEFHPAELLVLFGLVLGGYFVLIGLWFALHSRMIYRFTIDGRDQVTQAFGYGLSLAALLIPSIGIISSSSEDSWLPKPVRFVLYETWFASLPAGLVVIAGLYLFYIGYRGFSRTRLIKNIPTVRCLGVTVGLNEVRGTVRTDEPLQSHLGETDCVYYEYEVKEERTTDEDDIWVTIHSGGGHCPFELQDDTGSIHVNPEGAEFKVRRSSDRSFGERPDDSSPLFEKLPDDFTPADNATGNYVFREWTFEPGDQIYVLGSARIDDNPQRVRLQISEDDEPLYLISTFDEDRILKSYESDVRWGFPTALVLVGLAPLIYAFMTGIMVDQGSLEEMPMAYSTSLVVGLAMTLALGVTIVLSGAGIIFNSLVDLRHREERAWAMLDVAYKHRAELIPQLVDVAESFASHEQLQQLRAADCLDSLNDTSTQMDTAKAAHCLDKQTASLQRLFAITEQYPQLQANAVFSELVEQLRRCEQKVSLARRFYNNTVERLNTRLDQFPDRVFAPLAGASKQQLLEFNDFETKPDVHTDACPTTPVP